MFFTPGRRLIPLFLALASVPQLFAEIPERITDLWPDAGSGVPRLDAAVLADKLYFAASADGGGGSGELDLWVFDGASPAAMVPGSAGLDPYDLTVWQGALYFAGGPFADRELWRYDGVNPPVEALDLFPAGTGNPTNLIPFGPELCMSAVTAAAVGDELVCWDGATAPDVYELRAEDFGSSPEAMTVLGDTLYFNAYGDGIGGEPWAYESFFPPVLVGDLSPGVPSSNPEDFVTVASTLYFEAADALGAGRIWTREGVSPPAMLSSTFRQQGGLASWRGRLYADGYEQGAQAVESPEGGLPQLHVLGAGGFTPLPWLGGSITSASGFLEHRNALYFRSTPSTSASDIFRICGGGSVERVTDHFADSTYVASTVVLFQGRLYFAAFEPATGKELWAIDPFTAVFCGGFETGDTGGWSASVP